MTTRTLNWIWKQNANSLKRSSKNATNAIYILYTGLNSEKSLQNHFHPGTFGAAAQLSSQQLSKEMKFGTGQQDGV